MWHAWVDEAQPGIPGGVSAYILAAVICEPAAADEAREAMRALLLRGQRKLHWHKESDVRRHKIIEAAAALDCVEHIVVIRADKVGERPERRRRHCLERLFYELHCVGVSRAHLESRSLKQDKLDAKELDYLRLKEVVGRELRIDHKPGSADELLWIADAVCGAVGAFHVGATDVYWKAFESRATIHVLAS